MSGVDERVVRMEFEDANFEAGATKALSILEKLQNALKFEGASDGLDSVKSHLSGFNMSPVESAIASSGSAFSVFEQIGIGALRQIGVEVVNLASRITSRLTSSLTSGARDGFNEYQLQINSLQTIAANSGEKMDVIKKNLNELNEYADKTIYNFSEMTQNIGRFTAAGLDVETSTKSIKGFANMAALAGAGATETSRGMYQLSQAMAAGVIKLQDWKSIQQASIDTASFKDVLIETARAMNSTEVSVDDAIKKQGSFNQSLSEGWLTADVMAQALEVATMSTRDFADEEEGLNQRMKELTDMGYSEEVAKKLIGIANSADDSAREVRTLKQLMDTVGEAIGSGWAQTWELIIGDFEEATDLFTSISKRFDAIIGGMTDSRNDLIKAWKGAGGRDDLIGIFSNLFEGLTRIVVPIKDAFTNVFGVSGEQLAVLTENIAMFTQNIVISEGAMTTLKTVFENAFSIIHSIFGVMGNVLRSFVTTMGLVSSLTKPWTDNLASQFRYLLAVLEEAFHSAHVFSDGVGNIFRGMYKPIGLFIRAFIDVIETIFETLNQNGGFVSIFSSIGSIIGSILVMARRAADIVLRIGNVLLHVATGIIEAMSPVISLVAPALKVIAGLFKRIENLSLSFTKGFARFSDSLARIASLTGLVLRDALQIVVDFGEAIYKTLFDPKNRKTSFISDVFNAIWDSASKLMSGLGGIGSLLGKYVIDPLSNLKQKLENFGTGEFGDRVQYFSSKISEFRDSIVDFIGNDNIEAFKNWISNVGNFFSNVKITLPKTMSDFGGKFLQQAKQYVKGSKTLQNGKKILTDFSKKTLPVFGASLSDLGSKIKSVFWSIKKYFEDLSPQKLGDDISNLITTLVEKVRSFSPSLANGLSGFADNIKTTITNLTSNAGSFGDVFKNIKDSIAAQLETVPEPIKNLFDRIKETFDWGKSLLQNEAGEISFENIGINLSNLGTNVGDAISSFADGVMSIPDMTGNLFDTVVQKAQDFVGKFPSFDKIADSGQVLMKGGLIVALTKFVNSFKNVNKSVSGLADSIKKWPTALENGLKGFGEKFGKYESKADAILKVAGAMAILAGSLFLLASIPGDDLARAGQAMGALAVGLVGLLAIFEALEKAKFFNPAMLVGVGAAFSGVAIGVLALAGAAILLSLVPEEQLSKGIDAVIQLLTVLSLYALALRSNGKSLLLGSIGLVIMAGAISLLIGSVKRLGNLDADQMKQGLDGFTQLMTALAIFGAIGAKGISMLLGAFIKFGAGVLMLSISLGFLAAGLTMLDTSLKELSDVSLTLGVLAGFLGGFALACWALKDADPVSVGAGLLIFSVAIGVLAAALAGMSMITNTEGMITGALALAAIISIMGFTMGVLDPNAVIRTATSFVIFSAAVAILAVALGTLSYVDSNALIVATEAISTLLVVFGAMAKFIKPEATYATAMALIQFSAAVMILALAFKVLETVNMISVAPALIGVVAAMAVFAAGAMALAPAAGAIALIGSAMLTFSIAVLALAAAFWIFSAAISNLNSVGAEQTANLLSSFGEGLGAVIDQLIARMPDFISALVQGLLNGISYLIDAALQIGQAIYDYLVENRVKMVQAGYELLTHIGEGIMGAINVIKEKAPEIINALIENFGPFMGSVMTTGATILNTLKEGIGNALPTMLEMGRNIIQGLMNGMGELLSTLGAKALEIGTTIVNAVKGFLGIASPSTVMAEIGGNVVQGLINGIGEFLGGLGTKALEIGQTILNGIVELPGQMAEKAGEGMTWFVNGIGGFFGAASQKGTEIATSVGDGVATLAGNLRTKASDGMNALVSAIQSKMGTAKSKAEAVKTSVVNGFNTLASGMRSKASEGVNAFVGAISSGAGRASSAAASLCQAAKNGLSNLWGSFRSVGSDAVSGFINGLTSRVGQIASAAANMVSTAINAARARADSHSPSRVFMAIGGDTGEGYAIGIVNSISTVSKAASSMAEAGIDSFNDSLRAMSFDMDDLIETDYNPVITPVIDPTSFDSDLSMLSSAMNSRFSELSIGNLNYTGELSAKISDANDLNRQTIDAISRNGIDYDRLGVSVANALIRSGLHVELDGDRFMGYLAGEIADARRQYVG